MHTERIVRANSIDMHCREAGAGPLVLFCHGWPELSYSWRHQMTAIADAGYRVVAPDMRGFGSTDAPAAVDAYSIFHLVGDVVGLVAALGETSCVIVGHDWGAPVAWHAALFRPDIFRAVAGLSVPPPFRGKTKPLDALKAGGIHNFYWQYFQPPGQAEAEFERDVGATMRAVVSRGFANGDAALFVDPEKGFLGDPALRHPLPGWITEDDIAVFVAAYSASGFRGGLNWYRNIDRNWELTAPWQDAVIAQPSLFIAGARDSVVTGMMGGKRIERMDRVLTDLRGKIIIDGAGHWIQQERPDEVNAALIAFLGGLPSAGAPSV